MPDDAESESADPASSDRRAPPPSPAPIPPASTPPHAAATGWSRGGSALQLAAVAALLAGSLVVAAGGGGARGAQLLTRTALAASAVAVAAHFARVSRAARSARVARAGAAGSSQRAAGPAMLAVAALAVGAVQVVAPAAGRQVPVPAAVLLLPAAGLLAAALWLKVGPARPWWNPAGAWDAAITGVGSAAVGLTTLELALRVAGPHVAARAAGMVALSTLLADVAVAAATLADGAPRVGARQISTVALALAVADQASLATRGLPALVPGPGLPGSGPAAWPLVAALVVAAVAVATVPGPGAPQPPNLAAPNLAAPNPSASNLAASNPSASNRSALIGRGRAERRLLPGRRRTPTAPALAAGACAVLVGAVLARAGRASGGVRAGALLGLACLLASALGTVRRRQSHAGPDDDSRPRTDDLTGLANRRALAEALAGERSTGGPDEAVGGWSGWAGWSDEIALLLVDLDNFKDVNDALGHDAGDRLLTAVGTRLRTALRPTQLLARLGGDEFAVVLPAAGVEQAARVAAGLRDSLGPEFEIDGNRLHVRASVGAATCDPARGDPRDLLRQADVAMYQAKADGLGVAFYDPDTDDARSGDRLRRTGELRDALERGDLEVYLQPQVDLQTGTIVGAEALARWRHPQDGVLLPDSFLPLAERTGLMRPVTAQLVDRALAACAIWWQAGHKVTVSVNLGAGDLREDDVGRQISAMLDRHGLPPAALRVEITEQALLTDPVAVAATLRAWRAEGVTVAVDDFGTGYSSLSYLRVLPVDEVKLDRAFIGDAGRPRSATIVRHTAAMAHDLGAVVVAEGIEDGETARLVARLGCDVGQGLHFGAAMTVEQFLARLG